MQVYFYNTIMKNSTKPIRSHCPVNYGIEILWDKWSFLIIRDIVFHAKKTYGQFLSSEEKIATNILASRLEQLCEYWILEASNNEDDKRKILYSLTQKWLDLIPVMFEMMLWSYKYDPQSKSLLIPKLMQEIEKDNRKISKEIIVLVQKGVPIVQQYL